MTIPHVFCAVRKAAAAAVMGIGAALLMAGVVDAQEKKGKDDEQVEGPRFTKGSLVRAGYTRPGNPSDKIDKDGKIIRVAWDPSYKGRIIGATVYFAVYERNDKNPDGDKYGTGLSQFDSIFLEGKSTSGGYSPAFDTVKSRFLYLYQVVNDRGLDPYDGESFAGFKDIHTDDLFSYTLKLTCDPADITSWGHFKNLTFTTRVPDRNLKGQVIPAGLGKDKMILLAMSSNASILGSLGHQEFTSRSPGYPLRSLRDGFGLDISNLNLKTSKSYGDLMTLVKNKDDLLPWQQNMITAAEGGKEPNYIDLMAIDDEYEAIKLEGPTSRMLESGVIQNVVFKADFRGKNTLKLGYHSVCFGFTSNLPPTDTLCKIYGKEPEQPKIKDTKLQNRPDGFSYVALTEHEEFVQAGGAGQAPGTGTAPGTVPAPIPMGGGGGGAGGGNWIGGGGPSGGGGAAAGTGGGVGGTSGFTIPASTGGGGGIVGSSGGGQDQTPDTTNRTLGKTDQNGDQTQNQNLNLGLTNRGGDLKLDLNQTGDSRSGGNSGSGTLVNVNVNVMNQQTQFQAQKQKQKQKQSQNQNQGHCGCDTPGQVVPEPAALALGLLGVPALVMVLRRRKGAKPESSPS